MNHLQKCPLCLMSIKKFDAALLAGQPLLTVLNQIKREGIPIEIDMLREHSELLLKTYSPTQQRQLRTQFYKEYENLKTPSRIVEKIAAIETSAAMTKAGILTVMWEDVIPKMIEQIQALITADQTSLRDLVIMLENITKVSRSIGLELSEFAKHACTLEVTTGTEEEAKEHVVADLKDTINALKQANATLKGVG